MTNLCERSYFFELGPSPLTIKFSKEILKNRKITNRFFSSSIWPRKELSYQKSKFTLIEDNRLNFHAKKKFGQNFDRKPVKIGSKVKISVFDHFEKNGKISGKCDFYQISYFKGIFEYTSLGLQSLKIWDVYLITFYF